MLENSDLGETRLSENRNFVLLSSARFISLMGDRIHGMALIWYILNRLGTGAAIGTIMIMATLPSVILGPFTGVIADRFDRRKIMLLMDSIRAVAAVSLGICVLMGIAYLPVIFAVTIILSVCNALYMPTTAALFPNLVRDEQLYRANSISSFLSSLATCIGPAVSGLIIAKFGVEGAFLINGITFILSGICEYKMVISEKLSDHALKVKDFLRRILEGFMFVKNKPAILAMLLFGMSINFFFFPCHDIILPIIIKKILNMNAEQFGIITSVFPLGLLVSTLLLQIIPQPEKKHKFMIWSMFGQAMGLILLALPITPFFFSRINEKYFLSVYIVIAFVRGLVFGFSNVPMAVVNQRIVPNEFRGRVYALQSTCYQGLIPIAYGVAGFAVDFVAPYLVVIIAGIGMGAVCLAMFRVKEIREI